MNNADKCTIKKAYISEYNLRIGKKSFFIANKHGQKCHYLAVTKLSVLFTNIVPKHYRNFIL